MTTFVLVHGAWGGAHTWRTVRPLLWAEGHHVFTPALTGIGERSHLAHPRVGLQTHVDDVVNLMRFEGLTDVVLVGFSYGGMVITGALEHIADQVSELVYLDAFVPGDGQSVTELGPELLGNVDTADELSTTWLIPPGEREFEIADEAAFAAPRRTAQPIRTFTEPVRLTQPIESFDVGRTYIKATGDGRNPLGSDPFWAAADRCRDNPAWRYHEIASNHMIPQNRPGELAAILLGLS